MPGGDLLSKSYPGQKLDHEIVKGTSSSENDQKKKVLNKGWVPRPPNAFILYRSETQPKLVEKYRGMGRSSRDFSAMVGQMWRNETPEIRQKFVDMAAQRLRLHRESYPNYRYSPKKKPQKQIKTSTKPRPRPGRRLRGKCEEESDSGESVVTGEDDSDFTPSSPVDEKGFELIDVARSGNIVALAAETEAQEYRTPSVQIMLVPPEYSPQVSSHPSSRTSSLSPPNSRALSVASFNHNFKLLTVTDNLLMDKSSDIDKQPHIHTKGTIESCPSATPLVSVINCQPLSNLRGSLSSRPASKSFFSAPAIHDSSTVWDPICPFVEPVARENTDSTLKRELDPYVVSMQDIFPLPHQERSASLLATPVSVNSVGCVPRYFSFMDMQAPRADMPPPPFLVPSHGSGNPAGSSKRNTCLRLDTTSARQVTKSVSDKLGLWLTSAKTLSPLTAIAGNGEMLSDHMIGRETSSCLKDGREWNTEKAEGMLSATTPRALFGKFRSLFGAS